MNRHYFQTPDPANPAEGRRLVPARLWDHEVDLVTAAGVFSADGLDHATGVLLRESEPPVGPLRLLDLGCGYGPIALALALADPGATVDAVDVNDLALDLCAVNAERLGVADRVRPLRPEDVAPEAVFDQIWSNPPVRIGKAALHTLLLTWLPRLAPSGQARLVVGKNLGSDPLQRWLTEQGWPCERVASSRGFRVLAVRAAP